MSLKRVIYTDPEGRKKVVLLPEDATEEEISRGIPVGPPPLSELELPTETEIRLNNELFSRGIFTATDALKNRGEILSAIQAAFKIDVNSIIEVYAGKDYKNHGIGKKSPEEFTNKTVHYRRPRKPQQ